jgi:membrane-bound serine protease (ClpP class)
VSRTLPSRHRRPVITRSALAGLALVLAGVVVLATPAIASAAQAQSSTNGTTVDDTAVSGAADPGDTSGAGFVAVLKVNGLLDPVMVDVIANTVRDANRFGAVGLVLQVDSGGVVVPDSQFVALLDQIASSEVPVHVWVGPSGSALTGPASQLVGVAKEVGMAPGTRLGNSGPLPEGVPFDQARMAPLVNDTVSTNQAADLHITSFEAPTIGDFIIKLPGVQTRQISQGDQQRLVPLTQVQFNQLSLVEQMFHTVASPAVAYLLLTIGLALLIFELFTAGIGVAGVVGAGAFILACYGLAVLPTHWWGLVAIVAAMLASAIDVQTGIPRFWTGAGMALFVVGSLTLYDGVSMSWVTLLVGVVGIALTFFTAMPAMVRTRFSTPTIGREWMIGEMGRAVTPINPDGTVQLRDALWRAYTNRATPIDELDRVRVIGIEGLVLEVEPETGAARDYRERGPKTSQDEPVTPDDPAASSA